MVQSFFEVQCYFQKVIYSILIAFIDISVCLYPNYIQCDFDECLNRYCDILTINYAALPDISISKLYLVISNICCIFTSIYCASCESKHVF